MKKRASRPVQSPPDVYFIRRLIMMMMMMTIMMMMIKNIRYTRQPACYLTDALPIIRQCIAMHERLRDAKAGLGAKPGDLCKCVSV